MIKINKGASNTVILSLSERTTIEDANYLFEFIHDQTKATKYFIAEDISTNKIRFNEFVIEENSTEDLENGVVSLVHLDFWKYTIREQVSSTNLDPSLSGNIVEEGKVLVLDSSSEIPTFTQETTEIKVFNG
jgi:hypothetical protein